MADAPDLTSFNLLDLDVEELETRLEMTQAVPNTDCWTHCSCGLDIC